MRVDTESIFSCKSAGLRIHPWRMLHFPQPLQSYGLQLHDERSSIKKATKKWPVSLQESKALLLCCKNTKICFSIHTNEKNLASVGLAEMRCGSGVNGRPLYNSTTPAFGHPLKTSSSFPLRSAYSK